MAVDLRSGVILAGRLRLEHCIGEGGMGCVWSATHTMMQRRVAVKLLKGDSREDPEVRRRFLREGRAASAVRHPNVVEILDVLELEDGTPGMVMELLLGESFGQRLRRDGKMSLDELAKVLLPAISAVGTAHAQGIVHRDLKPDNIFLAKGPEGTIVVKVLDFGIAKITALDGELAQSAALTGTGAMLGTPHYMAPEQIFSDTEIDYRCDIWALGVIMYEALAGMRPVRGDNFAHIVKTIATNAIVPLEMVAEVPPEVAQLVGRMLSLDKEARPKSLREVKEVLQRYTDALAMTFGDPIVAPPATTDPPPSRHAGLRMSDLALLKESSADEGPPTIEATSAPLPLDTQRGLEMTPRGGRGTGRRVVYAAIAVGALLAAAGLGAWGGGASSRSSAATPPVDAVPSPGAATPPPAAAPVATPAPVASANAATTAARSARSVTPAPASSPKSSAAPSSAAAPAPGVPRKPAPGGIVETPPF